MKVTVFGAGAIGGWVAAALARSGVAVSIAARGQSLAALRRDGLRLAQGATTSNYPIPCAAAADLGVADIVIVAVKAHTLSAAADALSSLIGHRTVVVPLINGLPWWFFQRFDGPLCDVTLDAVDPGGRLASLVASQRIIGAVVHASVQRPQPGCVRVSDVDRLVLGWPASGRSEPLEWLAAVLARGGLPVEVSADIRLQVWAKLWGNINMNPLSALTRATTGRLLEDPHISALCLRMMGEMATCGERLGLKMAMTPAERTAVTRRLGDFKTSMLQDLERGVPLEHEPQLGAVVEVGQRLGVRMPCCEMVLSLIRQLSSAAAP
jgi:2-dehydropantoate 2-reductase